MARSNDPLARSAPTAPVPTTSAAPSADEAPPEPGKLPTMPKPFVKASPVQHFRVCANPTDVEHLRGGWRPQIRGQTVFLPKGKVLRSSNYDIEDLRKQGVELEEISPPPAAAQAG